MYGAEIYQPIGQVVAENILMKASTTITKGDFVHLEYDSTGKHGEVDMAAAGEQIYGVANETKTSTTAGEKIQVTFGGEHRWKVDSDEDTDKFGADTSGDGGRGELMDIVGTTGIQQVDVSTHTTTEATGGGLRCIDDIVDAADTSIGIYTIHEKQY